MNKHSSSRSSHDVTPQVSPARRHRRSRRWLAVSAASAGLASLMGSAGYAATVGTWIGPTSTNWSASTSWQDGIIPNGQGDTALYVGGSSQITLVDSAITVGTLRVASTANVSW